MTKHDLYEFLARQRLGVLGSVSPEGESQSALVGIAVTPDLEIVFDTVASSRKYRNLLHNPPASMVIGWEGEVTVQFEGRARQPEGEQLAQYQAIYFAVFPDGPSRLSWPGITYFVLEPRWIRYSDFAQSPTQIVEWRF